MSMIYKVLKVENFFKVYIVILTQKILLIQNLTKGSIKRFTKRKIDCLKKLQIVIII